VSFAPNPLKGEQNKMPAFNPGIVFQKLPFRGRGLIAMLYTDDQPIVDEFMRAYFGYHPSTQAGSFRPAVCQAQRPIGQKL